MICISLTSFITSKQLRLNDTMIASRIYVNDEDVPTFPNRLVFNLSTEKRDELLVQINPTEDECDAWINEEFANLGDTPKIIVPFILRTHDEAHTSFKNKRKRTNNEINISSGDPVLFLGGIEVPSLCIGCARKLELAGRVCPDFVANSLTCLKTGLITSKSMVLSLNEQGELAYGDSTASDEASDNE